MPGREENMKKFSKRRKGPQSAVSTAFTSAIIATHFRIEGISQDFKLYIHVDRNRVSSATNKSLALPWL